MRGKDLGSVGEGFVVEFWGDRVAGVLDHLRPKET
jgi:hypothetical protein